MNIHFGKPAKLSGGPNKILIADLRSSNLRKSIVKAFHGMVATFSIDQLTRITNILAFLAMFKIIGVTSKLTVKATKKQRLATTLIMTAREISDRTASIDRDAARMADTTRPRPSSRPWAKETSSSETVASFQKIDQHTSSCRGSCCR